MLAEKAIEPAQTEQAAPIIFAAKTDVSIRFYVDYRKLTAAIIKDSYPLQRMHERIDS